MIIKSLKLTSTLAVCAFAFTSALAAPPVRPASWALKTNSTKAEPKTKTQAEHGLPRGIGVASGHVPPNAGHGHGGVNPSNGNGYGHNLHDDGPVSP